jgi:uncharacterized protein YdeI (YjbR/CyaY-like superfamily)
MAELKRALNPMPEDVRAGLVQLKLVDAYEARPAYQRNDYLGWITRARNEETRAKRLRQMLDELGKGDVYMNMGWNAQGAGRKVNAVR